MTSRLRSLGLNRTRLAAFQRVILTDRTRDGGASMMQMDAKALEHRRAALGLGPRGERLEEGEVAPLGPPSQEDAYGWVGRVVLGEDGGGDVLPGSRHVLWNEGPLFSSIWGVMCMPS